MVDALIAAFIADPFKVMLGGGGAFAVVVFLVNLWRTRARPRVRLIGHTYNVNGQYECPSEVRVEIENVGREPTSVEPVVTMTCRYPKGQAGSSEFDITDPDRSLAPVTPREFVLTGKPDIGFIFSHFRVYTFKFSRGSSAKLRVLNASGQTAGPVKFWFLKCLFIVTGALPHVEG